jgi:hypothetical protein
LVRGADRERRDGLLSRIALRDVRLNLVERRATWRFRRGGASEAPASVAIFLVFGSWNLHHFIISAGTSAKRLALIFFSSVEPSNAGMPTL